MVYSVFTQYQYIGLYRLNTIPIHWFLGYMFQWLQNHFQAHVNYREVQYTKMTNKMQLCRIIYCSLAALHVSSDIFVHHHEHLNCITAAGVIHVSRCRPATTHVYNIRGCKYSLDVPDDERKYRSKHVEQPRNNKLSYTVASCWSFSYIISWCTKTWISNLHRGTFSVYIHYGIPQCLHKIIIIVKYILWLDFKFGILNLKIFMIIMILCKDYGVP